MPPPSTPTGIPSTPRPRSPVYGPIGHGLAGAYTYSLPSSLDQSPDNHHRPPPNSPDSAFSLSPAPLGFNPRITLTRHTRPHNAIDELLSLPIKDCALPKAIPQEEMRIDYRALTYLGTVDENLICPICRMPFVDPVDTWCEHTFCNDCISEALSHAAHCPIDRIEAAYQVNPASGRRAIKIKTAHRIIKNQLDGLLVKCNDCDASVPRGMLRDHLQRYCAEGLIPCPDNHCESLVKRKMVDDGDCLHYDVTCPDCLEVHQEIDMAFHREQGCKQKEKECEKCGLVILRCNENTHLEIQCSDVIAPCQWADYGCQHESKRKHLKAHAHECVFKLVGPMADLLKAEISALRGEIRNLNEKDKLKERRIKFLECGQKDVGYLDNAEMLSQSSTARVPVAWEDLDAFISSNQSFVDIIADFDRRMRQMSSVVTELEGRYSMLLFNETTNIKNDVSEIRSQQQVQNMYVRWLLNFRRQENQQQSQQQRPGGDPGASSGRGSGGSDGSSQQSSTSMGRRLSDSSRDLITKL